MFLFFYEWQKRFTATLLRATPLMVGSSNNTKLMAFYVLCRHRSWGIKEMANYKPDVQVHFTCVYVRNMWRLQRRDKMSKSIWHYTTIWWWSHIKTLVLVFQPEPKYMGDGGGRTRNELPFWVTTYTIYRSMQKKYMYR